MKALPRAAPVARLRTTIATHRSLAATISGLTIGATLSALGFDQPAAVRELLLLQSPGVAFGLLGALAIGAAAWVHHARRSAAPRSGARALHRWFVPGAVFLGAGAVLSSAIPVVPLVQLAHGHGSAALPLLGIVLGVVLGDRVFSEDAEEG